MESVTCPHCDLLNASAAVACIRCGGKMDAPPDINSPWFALEAVRPDIGQDVSARAITSPEATGPESEYYHHSAFGRPVQLKRRPKSAAAAIWSGILGIAGFPLLWVLIGLYINWFYVTHLGHSELILGVALSLILIIGGLACGIWGFRNAIIDPKRYAPRKTALPGIAISGAGLLLFPLVSAIAIPSFLESRRAANEEAALLKLKRIAIAQKTYIKSVGNGVCGDLEVMPGLTLLDLDTARPESDGYRFYVEPLAEGGCEIHALPLSSSEGDHSFYYSTADNQLRSGSNQGKPAGPRAPVIGGAATRTQTASNPPSY